MLLTAAVGLGQAPPPVPVPSVPAESRWAPPPPLPSAAQPYRPLQPADAPPATRPAAPAPTRPVLTLQKPAGADAPKPGDPKLPGDPAAPPAEPSKTDRDPPKAVKSGRGTTDKNQVFRMENEPDTLRRIVGELRSEQAERDKLGGEDRKDDTRAADAAFYRLPPVDALVEPGTRYQPKTLAYPPAQSILEPGYVMHRRLYFEDLNSERYGWEVGLAQPALSTLLFYKDTFLYPAKLASQIGEWYDTSAGKCLPGSPVPYYLYPEPVDTFGLLVGAGAITGVAAILP